MQWSTLLPALGLIASTNAVLRFQCNQLVVQRLDPLVNPGLTPSPHLHQIVGGNAFNATMDPAKLDIAKAATCTTCSFTEDKSNYWTAVLYFKARNGTYKRVGQSPALNGFTGAVGGMTVYYMNDALYNSKPTTKVTAFKPGFRMFVGDPTYKTKEQAMNFRQITYTCMQNSGTRGPESLSFPTVACPYGLMVNVRFPTCWDGKTLDTADHMSHMAYPENGTFEGGAPCPATHSVKVPQVLYETIWDVKPFNDKSMWPTDGSQPFVWSFGDQTGYGSHGDYVFGWEGDALQRAMDSNCYVSCPTLKTQNNAAMNKCTVPPLVKEDVDSWLPTLPGMAM